MPRCHCIIACAHSIHGCVLSLQSKHRDTETRARADSDFAEEATAVTLGHSTDQPTVFSDFSARVRAVIGSCLAAITCVEKSQRRPRAEGEGCGGLASVCLGPGRGPASRQELECRVEEILCENTEPGADTCRDTYHRCSTGAPGVLSSATRGTTSQ